MRQLVLPILFVASMACMAQVRTTSIDAELLMGLGPRWPLGSFTSIQGIPSPPGLTFSGNEGFAWFLRIGADVPLVDAFRGGVRLGLSSGPLTYNANERVPIAAPNGGVYQATLGHMLRADITAVNIEPYVRYQPLEWLALSVGVPLSFASSATYVQNMRFVDPEGLPFIDGSTEITTAQGSIPTTNPVVGVRLAAEGFVALNADQDLFAVPHVGYENMLGGYAGDGALQYHGITIGVGLRYRLGMPQAAPAQQQPEPALRSELRVIRDTSVDLSVQVSTPRTTLVSTRADTLVREDNGERVMAVTVYEQYRTVLPRPPAVLRSSVRLSFQHDDGSVRDEARMQAHRVRVTRTVPFMPLVVFDEGSSNIPDRYIRLSSNQAQQWKESAAIFDAPSHWQYSVLNIIGARMRANANVTITLLTYDDGTEEGRGLAERRLATVKDYVSSAFGINARRITSEIGRGQASQQPWVFISDVTRTVVSPVTATVTQSVSRLPRVIITPDVISESGIASWSLSVFQSGRAVRTFSDTGAVPRTIAWSMEENMSVDEALSQPILVELRVQDKDGASTRSDPGRIVMRSHAPTEQGGTVPTRTEVLRVLPPDIMTTPDRELFAPGTKFTAIEFYPATVYDEAEYLLSDAPVVKRRIDADTWFRRSLVHPEREFYQRAELYINDERRP